MATLIIVALLTALTLLYWSRLLQRADEDSGGYQPDWRRNLFI